MTSEIVVMNKEAAALAADSAVTFSSTKSFGQVNKIFTLSKYEPVGILMYNNAELLGVPWETIIKSFRRHLGEKSHDHLDDYAEKFWKWVCDQNELFPPEHRKRWIGIYHHLFYKHLERIIQEHLEQTVYKKGQMTRKQVLDEIDKIISSHFSDWDTEQYIDGMDEDREKNLEDEYADSIRKSVNKIFYVSKLRQQTTKKLRRLGILLLTRYPNHHFHNMSSGIVFVGFGRKDYFPRLVAYEVDVLGEKFVHKRVDRLTRIGHDAPAAVHAFAQSDMAHLFMEGVDSRYLSVVEQVIDDVLPDLAEHIVGDCVEPANQSLKIEEHRSRATNVAKHMKEELGKYRATKHTQPIVDIVRMLPKTELGHLSETLVDLTKIKRHLSVEVESVGGPIDVAIISKGDGFVWIKRKYYFQQDLNPMFVRNYLRRD